MFNLASFNFLLILKKKIDSSRDRKVPPVPGSHDDAGVGQRRHIFRHVQPGGVQTRFRRQASPEHQELRVQSYSLL